MWTQWNKTNNRLKWNGSKVITVQNKYASVRNVLVIVKIKMHQIFTSDLYRFSYIYVNEDFPQTA